MQANSIIEIIQQAIYVQNFELGDGKDIPKFIAIGNQKFEFKVGNETWILSLNKK